MMEVKRMRATLNLPDALIKDLLEVTGEKTKTKAICLAIEDFIRRRRRQKLLALSGKIHFDLGWEEMEARELEGMKEREDIRDNR
jgi:hypothetical protein